MTGDRAQQLQALPRAERRGALEAMVLEEFRTVLLMTDDDVLPMDGNYFDLGLTSLGVTTIRQRLEQQLGCTIDASVLFDRPTIERLVAHLVEEAVPQLFGPRAPQDAGAATDRARPRVDHMLARLYTAPEDGS